MDGCYWIYRPPKMARRDCDKSIFYLDENQVRNLPERQMLGPYAGKICPNCGKIIVIDEHSYDIVDS